MNRCFSKLARPPISASSNARAHTNDAILFKRAAAGRVSGGHAERSSGNTARLTIVSPTSWTHDLRASRCPSCALNSTRVRRLDFPAVRAYKTEEQVQMKRAVVRIGGLVMLVAGAFRGRCVSAGRGGRRRRSCRWSIEGRQACSSIHRHHPVRRLRIRAHPQSHASHRRGAVSHRATRSSSTLAGMRVSAADWSRFVSAELRYAFFANKARLALLPHLDGRSQRWRRRGCPRTRIRALFDDPATRSANFVANVIGKEARAWTDPFAASRADRP